MDKLYFYVCQLDKCLINSKDLLDTIQVNPFNSICTNYGKIGSEEDNGFAIEEADSSNDELNELLAALPLGTFSME